MNVPVLRINDPGASMDVNQRIANIVRQINKELEKIKQELEKAATATNA